MLLHTHHLHPHLLFPSPHSHASPFPFPFPSRTNTLRSRTFPATSIRTGSSSLRFHSYGRRIRNSAAKGGVSETEHNKQPRFWDHNRTFQTPDDDIDTSKPKYYVLDMFPYPSGAGLHVGHPLGYTATDILARYKRMQGYNVLHPMGWDAFGLPAEQYAIETGTHPKLTTVRNINRFRTQTQWIFLQLLKRGLAYQAEVPVNWCPALGTVLANEEVIDGVSERGGHPVIRKPMRQWMLKITAYADRLLEDLDDLDWPESVKEMQRNWIGRSEGAEMEFCILDSDGKERDITIIVYTTRPDTIFGATYLVVAPEHPLLSSLVSIAQSKHSIESGKAFSGEGTIVNSSNTLVGLDINGLSSNEAALKVIEWAEKSGNGKRKVNYKLRDWLFARQRYWGEPIPVIFLDDSDETVPLCETELPLILPELDDFSPTGTGEPPLSKAVSWVKTTDSLSGRPATRETNTMPQWAGSCWYYLRFMDPHNSKELVDKTKERYWGPVDVYVGGAEHAVLHLLYARFWHKVLFDIGVVSTKEPFQCVINQGIILGEVQYMTCRDQVGNLISADSTDMLNEHKLEIIPAEKVMKSGDSFVLKEHPDIRLFARAHKMSKSRGNVVNPDDVVSEYGADSLRLYEMFMGPLRFLGRTWRLIVGSPLSDGTFKDRTVSVDEEPTIEQLRCLHKCIAKVTEEIEGTRFNTGISAMMEFLNWDKHPRSVIEAFVLLLSPYAPHMAEELWSRLGHTKSLAYEPFPKANPAYLKDSTVVLPVQINGKTREEDAFVLASRDEKLSKYLDGQSVKKRIYVPGKILNVVLDRKNIKVGVQ
ncbi:hypothetical protein JHK85_020368 [Glycine max]|nr:hypothetical protein JHK85_020368 [Glycine max]